MADELLQRLLAATDPAEKAALVARSILSNEERVLAELVLVLAFLRWFDESVVAALLPETERPHSAEIFLRLIDLPFVERISYGYVLHDLTREGLLAEASVEQRFAAAQAADTYALKDDSKSLLECLYCLILGEQSESALRQLENQLDMFGGARNFSAFSAVFFALEDAELLVGRKVVERNAKYRFARGLSYSASGEYMIAIQEYRQAILLNPQYTVAYINRGKALSALGEQQAAIADYDRAIQLAPEYAEVYNYRGNALSALGEKRAAIADYKRAIQLNPKFETAYDNLDFVRRNLNEQPEDNQGYDQDVSINFGTDGWRAVISEEFTFSNVRKVAQAIADKTLADWGKQSSVLPPPSSVATRHSPPSLVVGFDTRFLSDRYAQTVAEVLAGNGIHVWLTQGDTPTPLVSYAVVDKQAAGGVMITASHNPPRYNGIKLKAAYGGSASPADAKEIEQRIQENDRDGRPFLSIPIESGMAHGLISRFDPLPTYRAHLHRLVDFDGIRRAGLTVAVDAMYGAGRVYLRDLLREAGCQVTELRGELNPGFGGAHPEPIARHLQPLFDAMATGRYHLGLATDGDADRIGAVDPDGRFIDPNGIMALLLEYLVEDRGLRGSVVKTVSTTQMINRLANHYGLPLHETPVGFNHISDLIMNQNVLLGGEESGGISIQGHIPEGDGLLMGLLLAEMVAKRSKGLSRLLRELMEQPYVGHFFYGRYDQRVTPFNKATFVAGLMANLPTSLAGVPLHHSSNRDGVKYILTDNSWLLIRPSGIVPVVRIYAEAHSYGQMQALLAEGGAQVQRVLLQTQQSTANMNQSIYK